MARDCPHSGGYARDLHRSAQLPWVAALAKRFKALELERAGVPYQAARRARWRRSECASHRKEMNMTMERNAVLLSKIGIGVLAAIMLMGGLCRRTVGTTIAVVNGTDAPVRNVEVTYSGGNIGAATIA